MFTYKIIDEKENKLESIIEKSGVTTKFTAQQVVDHLEYTMKMLKQAEGQLEVNSKQDEMAIEILPILKDIPEDKWQLVMAFAGRQVSKPELVDYIGTCKETISSYETQMKEIEEALGIEFPIKKEVTGTETVEEVSEVTSSEEVE